MFENMQLQKELVEDLKVQWKSLWSDRYDDHLRAEGIASQSYAMLFVEKGTVIHATRNFKALSFREILEQNQVQNSERHIPPHPEIGGWGKFIKTHINSVPRRRSLDRSLYVPEVKAQAGHLKKGGRGWLHK
jgi:hypothetical protein